MSEDSSQLCRRIAAACKVDPVVAEILIERGHNTPESARRFLYDNVSTLYDPLLFLDMDKAAARVEKAIAEREPMVVVGDSDADGITATAVLYMYLRSIGAIVHYFFPLNTDCEAFWRHVPQEFLDKNIRLVITVDNGVSCIRSTEAFDAAGMDIIITDHHECRETLPPVLAVVNPKRRDETYPTPHLSGAGVAGKLMAALAGTRGDRAEVFARYCDLVAIGTVADAMPLTGENRFIVRQGLEQLRNRRPGLETLLRAAGCNLRRPITDATIGFVIAPRLNAAGRCDRPDLALELLCAEKAKAARELAEQLSEFNRVRQQAESKALKEAVPRAANETDFEKDKLIILDVEDWPVGIAGIVASRLVDRYGFPCIIVSFSGEQGRGSARSLRGYNIFSAMAGVEDLLSEFGGHELACGFLIRREHFARFKQAMQTDAAGAYAQTGFSAGRVPAREIAAARLTLAFAHQLELLEPYGIDNPQPLFRMEGVLLEEMYSLANPRHQYLVMRKDGQTFTGILFGHSLHELECTNGDTVDILFMIDINVGRNGEELQLIVKKITVSVGDDVEDYALEYAAFMAGKADTLPPAAIPDRADVINVYSYLLRTMGETDADLPRQPLAMVRRISLYFEKPFNYAKLMLSLCVLDELGMVNLKAVGQQLWLNVNCTNTKKNLSESALWKRLR